jgi:hypothetical protein
MYRLWVGDEDYGTASEKAAKMWLAYYEERYPTDGARIEPVSDDAPVFLSEA